MWQTMTRNRKKRNRVTRPHGFGHGIDDVRYGMRAITRTEYLCGVSLLAAINAACWLWQPPLRPGRAAAGGAADRRKIRRSV
jgi:hypothetical protein